MSWSTNNIMELVQFLTNKNQSGAISAKRLFYAWNTEQAMYHADIVGRWQRNNNSKEGINTGVIQNETILTDLSPFTISLNIDVVSPVITKPVDFIYKMDLRIGNYQVVSISPDQISAVRQSVIDPPSIENNTYYSIQYEDYFYLLPDTWPNDYVTTATLDYIAECTDIVWGFSFDEDGRQVYNAGLSVQPKWKQDTIITITKRALTNLGVSYKDVDFTNFGRTAQATGN